MMKNLIFLLGLVLVLGVSCKSGSTGSTESAASDSDSKLTAFIEAAKEINGDVASPTTVTDIFELSGAPFMPELVNDPLNFEKYKNNNVSAALNLGVYLVDALYLYAYDKNTEGYNSLMAAKSLAAHIGFAEIFDETLIERYEDGNYPDSVHYMLENVLIETGKVLQKEERLRIYTSIVMGNYIEEMYILFSAIMEYPDKGIPEESKLLLLRELIIGLRTQLSALPQLISLIEMHITEEDPHDLINMLKELQEIRSSYGYTNAEIMKLTPEMIFKDELIQKMYTTVKEMRTYAVGE